MSTKESRERERLKGKHTAHLTHDGERFYLGSFGSAEAARAAERAEHERIRLGISDIAKCSGTLSLRGYAARIKVKPGTLKRWHAEGMPSIRVGSLIRIDTDFADAWVQKHHAKSVAFGRESVVYVAQRIRDEAIKIGWTSDVERRLRELRKSEDEGIVLLACFPGEKKHELALHERFAEYRIDGEWFAFPIGETRAIVRKALEVA